MLTQPPEPLAQGERPTSGAAYLKQRRAANLSRTERGREAAVEADQLHVTLSQLSTASRRLPPQDRRLAGYHGEMVLNGAYLVPDARSQAFADLIEQLNRDLDESSHLELNGPWPPYSFATLESTEPA